MSTALLLSMEDTHVLPDILLLRYIQCGKGKRLEDFWMDNCSICGYFPLVASVWASCPHENKVLHHKFCKTPSKVKIFQKFGYFVSCGHAFLRVWVLQKQLQQWRMGSFIKQEWTFHDNIHNLDSFFMKTLLILLIGAPLTNYDI